MSRRFVILATQRCGSNWLCSLLDSHPAILCHHELFNEDGVHLSRSLRGGDFSLGSLEFQRRSPLKLLENCWQQDQGFDRVGFKLNIGQAPLVLQTVLSDPAIQKIVLTRRNRLRAFVSEQIAQRTGQWESYPDSTVKKPDGPIHIEPAAVFDFLERHRVYYQGIDRSLLSSGQECFKLEYEMLAMEETHRSLLNFLGVDAGLGLRSETYKINPGTLQEQVSNFDELQQALAGTALEQDLHTPADPPGSEQKA
jgi:LPS sulfotransferase NodH